MNLWWAGLAAVLCLLQLVVNPANGLNNTSYECDFFRGRWVKDDSRPLYNHSTCPFIGREFNCQRNGRKDQLYLHYRWQPQGCDLTRFNGQDFLRKLRGKSIMFVGDSLSLNQWQSLTCLLYSTVPNVRYNITRQDYISTLTFMDYGLKVMVDRSVFLVDVVMEDIGRVLKLDSIEGGKLWTGMDLLIFNTWHWWNRRGPTQPKEIRQGKTWTVWWLLRKRLELGVNGWTQMLILQEQWSSFKEFLLLITMAVNGMNHVRRVAWDRRSHC
ncbi:Protein trichome birefringence-like 41 [Ancistrocladus abbreviatus]